MIEGQGKETRSSQNNQQMTGSGRSEERKDRLWSSGESKGGEQTVETPAFYNQFHPFGMAIQEVQEYY